MPIQHFRTETYLGRSSLGYLLKRAYVGLVDVLDEVVAPSGLTITHWVILINLRDGVGDDGRGPVHAAAPRQRRAHTAD